MRPDLSSPLEPLWWQWAGLALVVLGVCLVVAALVWPRRRVPVPSDPLADLRRAALARVDVLAQGEGADACLEISRVARAFIGVASDGEADYATASQLEEAATRDPRLVPVAQFSADVQRVCFDPSVTPDVEAVADRAREVVEQWR